MLNKNTKTFYTRKEKFVDPNSLIEVESAVRVGVRIYFDLITGQIVLTEQAFASDDAFASGAGAIPQTEMNHVIAGDAFDDVMKAYSELLTIIKELFKSGDAETKRLEKLSAETSEKARAERLEQLKKEVEAVGGSIVMPE